MWNLGLSCTSSKTPPRGVRLVTALHLTAVLFLLLGTLFGTLSRSPYAVTRRVPQPERV